MADMWNKYANTAARKHGKPGRETRPKSHDHRHACPCRRAARAEIVTPHLELSTDPAGRALHAGDPRR